MNKKLMSALFAVLFAMAMIMTGCSGNKDAINAAATGFFDGMQAGDLAAISEYATTALVESGELDSFDVEGLTADFYESMDIPAEDLDETAQAAVTDFCTNIAQSVVKSYEITDTSEEKGVGKVTAKVVLGFDPDKFDPNNDAAINEQLNTLVENYQNENLDALLDIYTNQGEDAFYQKLYSDLIPEILSIYKESITSIGELEEQVVLTIEQQEDKTWKVSGYEEFESAE